ncbi:helix-turn-helix domain-containing protein [Nonomuraea sp. NPDC005983]|uniref:TetR/AcrR family transcriptional regulator n=1 Tax=Nonomuraea sp. NPDC005983 TaxID=3155595 RepID=UPI0033B8BB05
MVGLRERKKLRTRQALIEAALRLFDERGYEETTLAEIAAEAEVSTRTFFSYFASKEDVIFFDSDERMERTLEILASREPGEPLADLLLRLIRSALMWASADDFSLEHSAVRMRLLSTVPALQARALHLLFDTQLRLAQALRDAYPDELDEVEAATAVGGLIGAVKLAVMVSLSRGDSHEQIRETVSRAADIAIRGLHTIG